MTLRGIGFILVTLIIFLYRLAQSADPKEDDSDSFEVATNPGFPVARPQPLSELLVKVNPSMYVIAIFTSNADATMWIETQSPQYGTLLKPEDDHAPYILAVSPLFNPLKVGEFLFAGYSEGIDDSDPDSTNFD